MSDHLSIVVNCIGCEHHVKKINICDRIGTNAECPKMYQEMRRRYYDIEEENEILKKKLERAKEKICKLSCNSTTTFIKCPSCYWDKDYLDILKEEK